MNYQKKFQFFLLTIIFFSFVSPTFSSAAEINNFKQTLYPYTKTVLENGLTLIVKETHTAPITAIDVWVGAGAKNEPPEFSGISHFLEHMLFKGTPSRPVGQISKEIEGVGGYLGGSTTLDKTHYYIVVPSEYTNLALEIEADVLKNSSINPVEIDKERKVILEELRLKQDQPQSILYWNFYRAVFAGTPYANDVLGVAETLSRINRDHLLDYFHTYYQPENIVLTVTGDVDTFEIINRVSELFKDFKSHKPIPFEPLVDIPKLKRIKRITLQKPVEQGYFLVGFPLPKLTVEESAAFTLLDIILGNGRSSRFYQELRENKKLVGSIGTWFDTYKEIGMFVISAQAKNQSASLVEKEIKSVIGRLLKSGVSNEELKRAKAVLKSELAYGMESNANIASFLGVNELYGDLDDVIQELDAISKATVKDIHNVARKYLNLKAYVFASVQPEEVKK
jgi:zinc protease